MAYTDRSPIVMQGKILIAERQFNGPVLEPFEWVGNSDNYVFSFKQKRESIKDNYTGRGLTVAAPVVETEAELMFNMIDISSKNWARSSWGSSTGPQAAGTGVSEAHLVNRGSYIQLANPIASNIAIGGLTLGADYVVERGGIGGLIRITDDAPAVTAETTVTVTYDHEANNGRIEGMVTSQKFYKVIMNGINVAQGGQPQIMTVHQIMLDAFKKADLIDKKQLKLETGGEILIDQLIPDDGELSQIFSLVRG